MTLYGIKDHLDGIVPTLMSKPADPSSIQKLVVSLVITDS
jgi:hypothetical protein